MVTMKTLIYEPLPTEGYDDEPIECWLTGKNGETSINDFRDNLNDMIISTLRLHGYDSGRYLVELILSDSNNGIYLECEEPTEAQCDIETKTVDWLYTEK
jgi:hypothetical protein